MEKYAMVVLCGRKWGLVCSLTRLVHFGPLPEEVRHKAESVAQVDAVMIADTRPGRTLGEVFTSAQDAYSQAGFPDEWQIKLVQIPCFTYGGGYRRAAGANALPGGYAVGRIVDQRACWQAGIHVHHQGHRMGQPGVQAGLVPGDDVPALRSRTGGPSSRHLSA